MDKKLSDNDSLGKNFSSIKNKKILILLGILVLMIIVILIAALQGKNAKTRLINNKSQTNISQSNNSAIDNSGSVKNNPNSTNELNQKEGSISPQKIALNSAIALVPGANVVSKDNKVLTSSGELAKNDVDPSSALAPQQTLAISKNILPESVIKIDESKVNGFVPNIFTVKAGEPVTISLTNLESGRSATLGFIDSALSGVILGARPSETRAITFNAPDKTGNYKFIDGIPGHSAIGNMIVK